MSRFTAESALAALELEQMLISYWREVDGNRGLKAHEFFTESCTYLVGALNLEGHEGVRKYYRDRSETMRIQNTKPRTSRHTCVNLQLSFETPDIATLGFTLLSYAGFGDLPIMDNTAPVSISDARLQCKRNETGSWQISEYRVTPIFVDRQQFAARAPSEVPS